MIFQAKVERWLTFLVNPIEARLSYKYQFDDTTLSNKAHMRMAADWLLKAQSINSDGGYSRKYNLLFKKWDASYIETTGYIIPTLFEVARKLDEPRYRDSALKAVDWLLKIQDPSGAFSDIDSHEPHVFDTGQCLIGLLAAYDEVKEKSILEAAVKAGDWLLSVQETDGRWIKGAYNQQPHSYYTRVAAALIELGQKTNNTLCIDGGVAHIEWVITNQYDNGFFGYCSFEQGKPAYLHTMAYVLEGLLKAHALLGAKMESAFTSALKNAGKLAELNTERSILLASQYNEDFSIAEESRCMTGLCQWAGICLDFHVLTGEESWSKLAQRTIAYLKARQIKEGENLCGAHTWSIPVSGSYAPNILPNWNAKFFIDALIKLEQLEGDSLSNQLDEWVSASFSFYEDVVSNQLCYVDSRYLELIKSTLMQKNLTNFELVDLGCGKGKFTQALSSELPLANCIGIDPYFHQEFEAILPGSVTKTNLDIQSVDAVLCIEVLQHAVQLEDALNEIRRILKKGGALIICDRNKSSILGLLKPINERRGKWMYLPDSPFVERWYSLSQWRKGLDLAGFEIEKIHKVDNADDRVKYWNRYHVIVARVI